MKIANEFTVSAPAAQAWNVLTDLEQVVPLMPGAQLVGQEGDDYLGKVKVKVGPVTSEFSGKAHFVERNGEAHRAVVNASGREARGTGNAAATITLAVHEAGERSRVTVDTDLKIVGKLAQFGSGMLQQVSEKLLGEFVKSLEAKLAGGGDSEPAAAQAAPSDGKVAAPQAPEVAAPQAPEAAPIDLLELAGGDALKKYGPVVFGAFALAAILFLLSRRIAKKGRRV
jgi:carbon monoxide dehydrogenase subunit G